MIDIPTAGSIRAILHEAKTGSAYTLIDEILHSVLFDWAVGNFEWRTNFCSWANGRKAIAYLKDTFPDVDRDKI